MFRSMLPAPHTPPPSCHSQPQRTTLQLDGTSAAFMTKGIQVNTSSRKHAKSRFYKQRQSDKREERLVVAQMAVSYPLTCAAEGQ